MTVIKYKRTTTFRWEMQDYEVCIDDHIKVNILCDLLLAFRIDSADLHYTNMMKFIIRMRMC